MRPKLNLKSKSQMPLSHEHVGSIILAKIKMYILTRAELLFNLCYGIPCTKYSHMYFSSSYPQNTLPPPKSTL